VRCSELQCVAVCCSVLQCVAVCCSVLQCCMRVAGDGSGATDRDHAIGANIIYATHSEAKSH